jgi:hypothetical protein
VQYGNDRAPLGVNNTANCTNTKIIDVMIINAFDINGTVSTEDFAHIFSSDAAIGTAVNK